MIRIIVENVILFLLPTLVYVIYVTATRTDSRKGLFDGAPLAWLLFAGTALMLIVLATYGDDTRGKPGQAYIPPSLKDGKIEPAKIK